MNKFDNQSDAHLADEYGELDARKKAIEAKLSDIKVELIRRGRAYCAGSRFAVTISEQSSTRLDTKALKEALGSEIIAEYEKTSLSTVARVKAIASEEVL